MADEPTGSLDSHTGLEIMALLQSLNEAGRTILLVTHDTAIASHAHRIITIRDGQIISDQPTRAPLATPHSKRSASIGSNRDALNAG